MAIRAPSFISQIENGITPAKAFAKRVFPQPGGPYSNTPLCQQPIITGSTLAVEPQYERISRDALEALQ
jgi:hypothetical protein